MTTPAEDFKDYAYDDEVEEDEEVIRDRQILKECFKLEDFLNYSQTRDILENEFRWGYEKNCEQKLESFWEQQVNLCRNSGATLFDNEVDLGHMGTFLGTVFSNLKPQYDLEIFYDTPSLASSMVRTHEDRKLELNNARLDNLRKNYTESSNNANKNFDWTSKSYKNS
ncbi:hypothetical protein N9P79_00085 [Crocinitomicaceae bacterium]|nr:hypothetical protein [Crocinitomicaceae bacterium]